MTHDVVAFLRAAHEEIEQVARASTAQVLPIVERCGGAENDDPGRWEAKRDQQPGCPEETVVVAAGDLADVAETTEDDDLATVAHIALHDPRSALARVQAERAILKLHEPRAGDVASTVFEIVDHEAVEVPACPACAEPWPCPSVLIMAHGHRHTVPGWRDEWAPEGA